MTGGVSDLTRFAIAYSVPAGRNLDRSRQLRPEALNRLIKSAKREQVDKAAAHGDVQEMSSMLTEHQIDALAPPIGRIVLWWSDLESGLRDLLGNLDCGEPSSKLMTPQDRSDIKENDISKMIKEARQRSSLLSGEVRSCFDECISEIEGLVDDRHTIIHGLFVMDDDRSIYARKINRRDRNKIERKPWSADALSAMAEKVAELTHRLRVIDDKIRGDDHSLAGQLVTHKDIGES